jgi:hypothetical protein
MRANKIIVAEIIKGGLKSKCIPAKGKIGVTEYPKRAECNNNFG